jgi:hypothetical protein
MLTLTPGVPHNLLDLIHATLGLDCPGTSTEFRIWAHPTNLAPVWLGCYMPKPGALSVHQYAYTLTPMQEPIVYRSSYPGTQTPIGRMQLFSETECRVHIEVVE